MCPGKDLKANPEVVVTKRGARLPVRWEKNNHVNGFVRWGLLPLARAYDAEAHEQGAFQYGCFSTGLYSCKADGLDPVHCIDDGEGHAYHGTIDIPMAAPDGDYMLTYAWFGGEVVDPIFRTLALAMQLRGAEASCHWS